MIPAKLHFPCITLQIIAGLIASAGLYVFLKYAPFPKVIKTIFPFTFFVLFQYAAVAKAYVLFPLLFFVTAHFFPKRFRHPLVYLILMLLISMVSLHGTAVALGLMAAYYFDVFKLWKNLTPKTRQQHIMAIMIYSILLLSMVYVLWIPKDYYSINHLFRLSPFAFIARTFVIYSDVLITNILYAKSYTILQLFLVGISLIIWYITFKSVWEKKFFKYLAFPLIFL
jgi:hypothetical protein